MMRMRKRLSALIMLGLLGTAVSMPAAAQEDIKIGVVNLPQLVSASPQAQRAKENMENRFAKRKEDIEKQQEQLQADIDRLKRDGSVMSEDAREKLEDKIRDQQRRLQLAQQEYNEDVSKAERKELEALRDDVRKVIDDFATNNGYDLIVGDGVLYAGDRVNVTQQILARLKEL